MLCDYISPLRGGLCEYTELRAQENIEYTASYCEETGLTFRRTALSGVCARAYRNGVYGFSSSDVYDEASARRVLGEAEANARVLSKYAKNKKVRPPELPDGYMGVNSFPHDISRAELAAVLDEAARFAHCRYPGMMFSASFHFTSSEKLLAVHSGLSGRSNIVLGSLSVTLKKTAADGSEVSGMQQEYMDLYPAAWFGCAKKLYALIDRAAEAVGEKASEVERELPMPEGGAQVCILSPDFTGLLAHESVGHTCEADSVMQEGSVAAQYMGQQVASPLVSLTDFAREAYGEHLPINMYIDDEGVRCIDAQIIRDGVLVGCMTNRDAAEKLHVVNTGNARASDYFDEPIIRMRNTCFHKGESKLDDMIASVDHGYFLTKGGGGNGGVKGEFNMFIGEAFEIVNGKVGRKMKPTMVSGIAWDALKTVTMVSDVFECSKNTGICGKKQSIPTAQGGPHMKLIMNMGGK